MDINWKDGKLIKVGLLSKENQKRQIKYNDSIITVELLRNKKMWLDSNLTIMK